MNKTHKITILYIFFALLLSACSTPYEKEANEVASNAGSNRAELEKVLDHYRTSGDNDKYEAACYHRLHSQRQTLLSSPCQHAQSTRVQEACTRLSVFCYRQRDACHTSRCKLRHAKIYCRCKHRQFTSSDWQYRACLQGLARYALEPQCE